MDGTKSLDTSLVDTLERTDPDSRSGFTGFFTSTGTSTPEGCLPVPAWRMDWQKYGSHPQNIDSIFQGELHVLRSSHLGSSEHTGLLLHLLHPSKATSPLPSKPPGLVRGFQMPARKILMPLLASMRAVSITCCSVRHTWPAIIIGRFFQFPEVRWV